MGSRFLGIHLIVLCFIFLNFGAKIADLALNKKQLNVNPVSWIIFLVIYVALWIGIEYLFFGEDKL